MPPSPARSSPSGSTGKTLEGSLRSFNLFEVLQFVRLGSLTGVLVVERENEQIQLMVRNGKIVNSSIFTHRQRLGELLLVRGILTRRELNDILSAQRDGTIDIPLGQVLAERGILDQEMLQQTLRLQLEEEIWALLNWSDGDFRFEPCDTLAEIAPSLIELEIEPLIMEGTRRQDEWRTITQLIPSDDLVPVPTPPEEFHDPDRSLTANEWRVLSLINGKLTVGSLVDRSGLGRFETFRILANFVQQDWIACETFQQAEERTSSVVTGRREGGSSDDTGLTSLLRRRKGAPMPAVPQIAQRHATVIGLAASVANELLVTAQRRRLIDPLARWPLTPLVWQRLTGRFPAADGVTVTNGLLDSGLFDTLWAPLSDPNVRAVLAEDTWGAISELVVALTRALVREMGSRDWSKFFSQLVSDIQSATVAEEAPFGYGPPDLITVIELAGKREADNGR